MQGSLSPSIVSGLKDKLLFAPFHLASFLQNLKKVTPRRKVVANIYEILKVASRNHPLINRAIWEKTKRVGTIYQRHIPDPHIQLAANGKSKAFGKAFLSSAFS